MKDKRPMTRKYKNEIKAYALIAFPMLWWGLFFVVALISAIVFSFSNLGISIDKISAYGTENYLRILDFSRLWGSEAVRATFDIQFWKSLGISAIWTVGTMLGNNLMGLLLAFLINKIKRGKKLLLAMLFWPSLVSAVVGASLTLTVFASGEVGLANQLLAAFGMPAVAWFDTPSLALPALMVMPVFLGFPVKLLIYYAAILAVPESLYEAASLDTTSDIAVFFRITLPLIMNAVMINVVLSLIEGLRVLGPMQLVTEGGPDNSTMSVMLYIYNLAFGKGTARMGRASAYSMVLFVIIMALTALQQWIFRDKEDNNVAGA